MAFVDEIKIYARAGRGGDGVVRWRQEKFIDKGGPAGGDGGKGGDVYVVCVRDVHLLSKYKTKKDFRAENGRNGSKKSLQGKDGEDLEINLPIGSIIKNLKTGKVINLYLVGEKVKILRGGIGGYGNEHFKSSTNVTPTEATKGKAGEDAEFFIELELIADVGLIGLPNAGKTSLLNALTHAKGKIGDYPFTTLEPSLGECFGYIISDIPGLVEGASEGKGLGHKFLRHVRRTNTLVHLVSLENEDIAKTYNSVRKELGNFDKELLNKNELIVLTKTDLFEKKELDKKIKEVEKKLGKVNVISVLDDDAIKTFREMLLKNLKKYSDESV
jgi:GTP-binding protein